MWRSRRRAKPVRGTRPRRVLHVADSHVVRLERKVTAAQVAARDLEIARGALDRLARIEAVVGAAAACEQALVARVTAEAFRELPAGCQVHVHPKQAGGRPGEDLGKAAGAAQ